MARLFISHATKDEAIVEEFVDLLQIGIGVRPEDIFCSSLPGMGIPTGKDFVDYVKSKIQNPELVLLVLSPEFSKSEFCQNEAGATWVTSIPMYPILVPPLGYDALRGVLAGKQAAKLDDKEKLNDLRDDLTERLNLPMLRTSHWERKRDKFLTKLTGLISSPDSPHVKPASGETITSSGSWLKLNDRFYEAHKVERPDRQKLSIAIFSASHEEEAALDGLRPQQYGRGTLVEFAYQNDGGMVQIEKVTLVSHGGRNLWTLDLTMADSRGNYGIGEMNVQGHSADEIAEMRAGRLLINDPPPPKKRHRGNDSSDLVEYAIVGGSDSKVKVDGCVVCSVFSTYRSNPEQALAFARLEVVFRLKATGTVEHILDLTLGPVVNDELHVRFRGRRARQASNVEPETISIEGDCSLV